MILETLRDSELSVIGRLEWSSNFTFLLNVGGEFEAIYKPEQGEQPLWDFEGGLFKREVAAYELSLLLGWPRIPETIIRKNAPYGVGSLQRFVPHDPDDHYFTMFENREDLHASFMEIAAFDLIANNADRKSGHCLLGSDGNIYAIDHGLCFHTEPKLRTVIWDFAGSQIPDRVLKGVEVALEQTDSLESLLNEEEITGLKQRMLGLLDNPIFEGPTLPNQFPWPLV